MEKLTVHWIKKTFFSILGKEEGENGFMEKELGC
jgi:hypothetical protein